MKTFVYYNIQLETVNDMIDYCHAAKLSLECYEESAGLSESDTMHSFTFSDDDDAILFRIKW